MIMTNLFELASRKKFRFASKKGELTVEQLWDLPLTASNQIDLENVARAANQELKDANEESFVATSRNPAKVILEQKLELVKHIIVIRLAEQEKAKQKQANAAERKRLIEIRAKKQDQELEGMSKEDIDKRIDELSE
jgi:phosphopantothenoylcysteine synthetase/decarboxylase